MILWASREICKSSSTLCYSATCLPVITILIFFIYLKEGLFYLESFKVKIFKRNEMFIGYGGNKVFCAAYTCGDSYFLVDFWWREIEYIGS